MDCVNGVEISNLGPVLVLKAALSSPSWQCFVGLVLIMMYVLYNFLEIHLIGDLLTGLRRNSVQLVYHPGTRIATQLLPKCEILKGRYCPTPWLCSPHLQTAFLHFFGRPPLFEYFRQIFSAADGGTVALDWLIYDNVGGRVASLDKSVIGNGETPIVIVLPGLTSDSNDSYVKHIVYALAQKGWKTVVANHRGLGGTSITSDHFYNAGWTEDLRRVIGYLHREYPKAPLSAVGTSIGANILVKYLGEEGENTPLAGAAAVCCPWDLVVCDRFINRKLVQRVYDKVLTIGLQGYAQLHQNILTRLADWECIKKSRSIRDFDNSFTCRIGKFETVDTYYRRCSSVHFLSNVSVPLLCVNALDDPVCTKEAIPWDECRINENIVLAATLHGGHLAYFEGFAARSIWWVGAVKEFLTVLHSSSLMHSQKMMPTSRVNPMLTSSIDKGPYVNVSKDGMVIADNNNFMYGEGNDEDIGEVRTLQHSKASPVIFDQYQSITNEQPSPTLEIDQSVQESMLSKGSQQNSEGHAIEDSQLRHSSEDEGSIINLSIEGRAESIALQSALCQLLEQIQASSKGRTLLNPGSKFSEKHALSPSKPIKELVNMSSNPGKLKALRRSDGGAYINKEPGPGSVDTFEQPFQKVKNGVDGSALSVPVTKNMMSLSRLQRCSIWLLAYIAIVTSWPLVGSALMINAKRKFKTIWSAGWLRK